MTQNEKFLTLYKELEGILREQGVDYKELEDKSNDEVQNKLRICRQIRNFMSHNEDANFLSASEAQIKFLTKIINERKVLDDIAKKHLGSITKYTCKLGDKCSDVLAKMVKLKTYHLAVYSDIRGKASIGVVTIHDAVSQLITSKTTKVCDIKRLSSDYIICVPETKMEFLPDNKVIYCFEDGTINSRLLGIVIK